MTRYTLTRRGERAYMAWYVVTRTGVALIPVLILSAFLGR